MQYPKVCYKFVFKSKDKIRFLQVNFLFCFRNNKVWGSKAPPRSLRTHRRSLSDPNITLPTPKRESPISCHQLESSKLACDYQDDAIKPMLTEEELRKSQLIEINPQTTEQKVWSYLASMQPDSDDEEDQGISENSPLSNSNSSLSSPICLTPPDEGYLDKWKDGKVIPSNLPQKMSDQLVGKDIVVPSPLERDDQVMDVAEATVGQDSSNSITPSKNSHFKPYNSTAAEVGSSVTSQHAAFLGVCSPGISQSRSFPENLSQLVSGSAEDTTKEEKELAPRPVSVIGMSPSHRRVHSEAITVMPSQKDWELMEQKKYNKSISLIVTKQIESVKERVKEMEQKHVIDLQDNGEIRKSTSCMSLRAHCRKGSVLSNSSHESSRPISQLSAHEKEDEMTKKRHSDGSSPVNLTQISEIPQGESPQETKPHRNDPSPTIPEDGVNCSGDIDGTVVTTTQIDTVKAIVQDIEQKSVTTQLSTCQVKKRPLSESLSCLTPHSPIPATRTSHIPIRLFSQSATTEDHGSHSPVIARASLPVTYKSLGLNIGPTEENSLSPPLKSRQHARVRSYSSSPLTSPKLSPRLKRASPDASEVFDHDHSVIPSMGNSCYSKEKLSRRRSLDIYQKHGDFNLTSIPSVSHLKRLFEETAKSQPSTSRSTSPNLKRSYSLRDLFISGNHPVCRSSSLRSEGKPNFRK